MKKNDFRALPYVIAQSKTMSDVLRGLSMSENGRNRKILKTLIEKNDFDISHFGYVPKHKKYEIIEKMCPVCGNKFKTKKGHLKEQTTCSYSCSNTYFRSGENNGGWKEEVYRTTCFLHHKKKCIICDEKRIVSVHHYDENRKNNSLENLMPMCPTHHTYWHNRQYKYLVEKKVDKYRKNFIKNMKLK